MVRGVACVAVALVGLLLSCQVGSALERRGAGSLATRGGGIDAGVEPGSSKKKPTTEKKADGAVVRSSSSERRQRSLSELAATEKNDNASDEVFVAFSFDPLAALQSAGLKMRSVLRLAWKSLVRRYTSLGARKAVVEHRGSANLLAAYYPKCRAGSSVSAAAALARKRGQALVIVAASTKEEVARLGAALRCEALSAALDDRYVVWAAATPQAFAAARRLLLDDGAKQSKAFIALALPLSNLEVVATHAARQPKPEALAESLERWLERTRLAHAAELALLERDAADAALITEQNRELKTAVADDRQRRESKLQVEADVERQKALVVEIALRREQKAAALPSEPSPAEPSCVVALRLPNGTKISRRFRPECKGAVLLDWADVLGVDFGAFELRKAASGRELVDPLETLADALGGRALLDCSPIAEEAAGTSSTTTTAEDDQ